MSFAWPFAWALAALAIPIVLFYLIRQKVRLKPVSTVLFWQSRLPQVHNVPLWQKLRRLVSLLLQLLFLALLVGALSRPLWPGQSAKARSVIIVVDAGPTMTVQEATGPRWELLKERVSREIDSIGFLDEAMLINSGETPEILQTWTGRRSDLAKAFAKSEPRPEIGDLGASLALARDLVAGKSNGEVVVVSDGVWKSAPDLPEKARLELIGHEQPNAGVTLFAARRSHVVPGEFQAEIVVERNEAGPAKGELLITLNGSLRDAVPVVFEQGRWTRNWKFQDAVAIDLKAEFRPEGTDAWTADNTARAELSELKPLRVALVSEKESFLEAALKVIPNVEVSKRKFDATHPADLWIFDQVAPPSGFQAAAALLIRPSGEGFWGANLGNPEAIVVSELREAASFLQHVKLLDTQILAVDQYRPQTGLIFYAAAPDRPVLFGNWERAPRLLVTSFAPEESDIVFRTAFPILISNLSATARDAGETKIHQQPGSIATLLKTPELQKDGPDEIRAPRFTGLAAWPLWWLALAAGLFWLVGEWFLYTRRITE